MDERVNKRTEVREWKSGQKGKFMWLIFLNNNGRGDEKQIFGADFPSAKPLIKAQLPFALLPLIIHHSPYCSPSQRWLKFSIFSIFISHYVRLPIGT